MNEIVLRPFYWCNYQPNIVIAIFLKLYCNNTLVISKENLGSCETLFNGFIAKLMDSIQIDNMYLEENESAISLISKKEDNDKFVLYIDKDKYTMFANKKITYRDHFLQKFRTYLNSLRNNELKDYTKNQPSWSTLSKGFIKEIDTTCILQDYKLFGLMYIQVVANYILNHAIGINWININPNLKDNCDILDDSSWNVSLSISLKNFMQKAKDGNYIEPDTNKPIKYTARELKFINYLKDNVGSESYRIEQNEILEALNPDGHIDGIVCKNPRKYVSNFISRLNKKYLHNTGHKLIECKEFRNCYVVFNTFEDNEDF